MVQGYPATNWSYRTLPGKFCRSFLRPDAKLLSVRDLYITWPSVWNIWISHTVSRMINLEIIRISRARAHARAAYLYLRVFRCWFSPAGYITKLFRNQLRIMYLTSCNVTDITVHAKTCEKMARKSVAMYEVVYREFTPHIANDWCPRRVGLDRKF